MFFEGSFEILLFPQEQLDLDEKQIINTYNKAHILIFKMAIRSIQDLIHFVKYALEHNLFTISQSYLSKYLIISKKCKAIDIVELGFALFHTEFFVNRTGEPLILYEFIENLGKFFGIEINNVNQRLAELHNRIKNPVIFLEQLMLTYSANLKR